MDSRSAVRAFLDGFAEVGHFEDAFLDIPNDPENDGVDVHRHGVARESGLGARIGNANALIDKAGHGVDYGDDEEEARSAKAFVLAEAEESGLFPLVRDLDRKEEIHADQEARNGGSWIVHGGGRSEASEKANDKQEQAGLVDAGHFVLIGEAASDCAIDVCHGCSPEGRVLSSGCVVL